MQTDFHPNIKKVLIIDDDLEICELLKAFLQLEKYNVIMANSGLSGLETFRVEGVDLIILDIGLPDISGQQICKLIRQESSIPIIILSANDNVSDKVICLEYGADDYISKPFEAMELMARIKAVLRRSENNTKEVIISDNNKEITFHGIIIDMASRQASTKGIDILLTPKEFELLVYFSKNSGQTLARDKIIEDLWGKNTLYRWSRSLDVHIQNLRQKVELNPKNPSIIKTVSGIGYRIKALS